VDRKGKPLPCPRCNRQVFAGARFAPFLAIFVPLVALLVWQGFWWSWPVALVPAPWLTMRLRPAL
jgi:hypothetical protein